MVWRPVSRRPSTLNSATCWTVPPYLNQSWPNPLKLRRKCRNHSSCTSRGYFRAWQLARLYCLLWKLSTRYIQLLSQEYSSIVALHSGSVHITAVFSLKIVSYPRQKWSRKTGDVLVSDTGVEICHQRDFQHTCQAAKPYNPLFSLWQMEEVTSSGVTGRKARFTVDLPGHSLSFTSKVRACFNRWFIVQNFSDKMPWS